MNINKARSYDQTLCIDFMVAVAGYFSDSNYASITYSDVRGLSRVPCAVDDESVSDNNIKHLYPPLRI
jgi:hypothetical protein